MQNVEQETARFAFRVKEGGETPHIALEPFGDNLNLLKRESAYLFFELLPNTTLEEAQRLAEFLGKSIMAVGYFVLR